MRILAILIALATAVHAAPAPRSFRLLALPGAPLGAVARSGGFCDAAQRAVLWLDNGDVVAVDRAGRVERLARVRPAGRASIVCDRRGAVHLVADARLVTIRRGRVRTSMIPPGITDARVLPDDALALLDRSGTVYRWDGARATASWRFAIHLHAPARLGTVELAPDGERVAALVIGQVILYARGEAPIWGPRASAMRWADARSLAVVESSGMLARWTIGAATTEPVGVLGSGAGLIVAGSRVLVRTPRALRVVEPDATGVLAAAAALARVPDGVIAAGAAPFAVVAGARAVVVDLTRSGDAVDAWHPLELRALAFSPDGRSLAMLGGDDDVLVARIDRGTVERRVARRRVLESPLRWAADGTIVARSVGGLIRWNLDGTETVTRSAGGSLGLTRDGREIGVIAGRIVVGPGTAVAGTPALGISRATVEADASARFVAVTRGLAAFEIYALEGAVAELRPVARWNSGHPIQAAALVGDEARALVVDNHGGLHAVDARGEHALAVLGGRGFVAAASPDRELVAIGSDRGALAIWSHLGVQRHALTARGPITALAWSPDNHTLAVATTRGIELWLIPR